ncbi:hypothetical protein OIDMADRAFT_53053 [Oidiodendron maius Zn]|uniref:Uncharacterized protein n=1 Tax=Oidiodendron maius (strain Zn) TaxID=913774 RepID=A0A0C3DMM1_OIDMZ|nr:hypothetical protein OIDMADRAFT_53053 [Oidiodendron maius Zn]
MVDSNTPTPIPHRTDDNVTATVVYLHRPPHSRGLWLSPSDLSALPTPATATLKVPGINLLFPHPFATYCTAAADKPRRTPTRTSNAHSKGRFGLALSSL